MRKQLSVMGLILWAGFAVAQQPSIGVPPQSASVAVADVTNDRAVAAVASTKRDETTADQIVFNSAKDRLSYAVGVELAAGLKWNRIDVDMDLLMRGLRDALSNDESKLQMSSQELIATLKDYRADRKRGLAHAVQMASAKNKAAGAQFAAKNAKQEGVVVLPSGVQYRILKQGKGKKPTLSDIVECHYRGTLVDGTEFDNSYKRGEPATAPLKNSISGWKEILQLMSAGSKWQVLIPPDQAYGEQGAGDIGPNATLIFEIELLSIKDATTAASRN